jgi:hypothetical protein
LLLLQFSPSNLQREVSIIGRFVVIIVIAIVAGLTFADFIQLITALGLLVTAAVGVLTYIQSRKINTQQVITHGLVNSQSEALLSLTRTTSKAEGVREGKQSELDVAATRAEGYKEGVQAEKSHPS